VLEVKIGDSHYYKIINIGRQTLEKRKWDQFDKSNINIIIFVSSLIDFDKDNGNQMKSSITLFKEVCQHFKPIPIIRILTKSDRFELMLQEGKSIKNCFEDYNGSNDFKETTKYIESQFEQDLPLNDIEIFRFIVPPEVERNIVFLIYDTVSRIATNSLFKDKGFII